MRFRCVLVVACLAAAACATTSFVAGMEGTTFTTAVSSDGTRYAGGECVVTVGVDIISRSWAGQAVLPSPVRCVAFSPRSQLWLAAAAETLFTSRDGLSWSAVPSFSAFLFRAQGCAWADDRFVAVGSIAGDTSSGKLFYARDANVSQWTEGVFDVAPRVLSAVAYSRFQRKWSAVGADSRPYISGDGQSWAQGYLYNVRSLWAVTFCEAIDSWILGGEAFSGGEGLIFTPNLDSDFRTVLHDAVETIVNGLSCGPLTAAVVGWSNVTGENCGIGLSRSV
jgi:hypothetical protein